MSAPAHSPEAWAEIVRGVMMANAISGWRAKRRERQRRTALLLDIQRPDYGRHCDHLIAANVARSEALLERFQEFAEANQMGTILDENMPPRDRACALRFSLGQGRARSNGAEFLSRMLAEVDAAAAEWMAGKPERDRQADARRAAKDAARAARLAAFDARMQAEQTTLTEAAE